MKTPTYEEIKPYIERGLVNEQVHPENGDVRIFNYTQECQFSKAWDDITRQCRGLIMNVATGEVLARPFPKFFNYQEHVQNAWPIPDDTPVITEKLDGSLGILYKLNGKAWIATRGSFMSDQAQWATQWFREHATFEEYDRDLTYLFEILIVWNRIVVNYDYEGLVLLAINETKGSGFYDIRGPKGVLSQRSSRDDSRKHTVALEQEVEDLPGVQDGDDKTGLSETQSKKEEVPGGLERNKQGEDLGLPPQGVSEATGVSGRTEEGAVYGLRQDISSMRDGFRPREGEEVEGGSKDSDGGGDLGRDKEVRSSLLELPQDKNIPHKKIRTSKAVELTSVAELMKLDVPNSEGFVIFYPKENVRMKVKFPEYVRLHKIITGVSEIGIWEMLKDGKDLKELIEKVPDEFFKWVHGVSTDLLDRFAVIADKAEEIYEEVRGLPTRKDQALAVQKYEQKYHGIVFALLSNKPPAEIIWKMLRPHGKSVFKVDIDL